MKNSILLAFMALPSDPLSEDDYPDDHIVSTQPFELGEDDVSINYIKEEGKDFFKPLNVQIKEKNGKH